MAARPNNTVEYTHTHTNASTKKAKMEQN